MESGEGLRKFRRKQRVPLAMRLVVSLTDATGAAVRGEAETIDVNLHGAKIRTSLTLRQGMRIKIFLPAWKKYCAAAVVRAHGREFGIELEGKDNPWGLIFQADNYREQLWERFAAARRAESAPAPAPAPERQTPPPEISAEGLPAVVCGLSLCRSQFLEQTRLFPGANAAEAILGLRTLVETGTLLRVRLPGRPPFLARVTRTGDAGQGRTVAAVTFVHCRTE
jgi:hypothetical protein